MVRGLAAVVAALTIAGLVGVSGPAAAAAYDPAADSYSMARTTAYIGAQTWWSAGYTGRGVDVAVIDTGVAPVPGLDGPGKVVNGPDLSLESQNPTFRYLDTNGHGTFMAGLIAGHDAALTAPYGSAPASAYRGIAPDARIVNVKVGIADGGVDVTQVIAAIYWVIEHKNHNGLNIRVLNLSYGTNSQQAYGVDPLAYAVEQAWRAGIFVVVAAGNEGYVGGGGNMSNPARDPFAVAVGAADSNGTAAFSDDRVAAFSAVGSKSRHVDLVTPGSHLQGLRVPGSYVDQNHPEGLIDARYFRGSGTSQAAAILSGAAALAIQQRPSITPGQLKLLLMNSAVSIANNNAWQGRGELDLRAALTAPSTATDSAHTPSTGAGSLELARGSEHLTLDGVTLTAEKDIFGHPFNSAATAAAAATGSTWTAGNWNGSTWSGSTWAGSSWAASTWAGSSWSGKSWAGRSWAGRSWAGSSWDGSNWSGSGWSGSSWASGAWT